VVSQRPLHGGQSHRFKGSHLSCARDPTTQCQRTVKLHRVFSSYRDSPGIFTGSAISPGLASRQYPHRDTIRAGRNFKVGFPPLVRRGLRPGPERTYLPRERHVSFLAAKRMHRPLHRCRDRTISSSGVSSDEFRAPSTNMLFDPYLVTRVP
jgi:hypothetical protein